MPLKKLVNAIRPTLELDVQAGLNRPRRSGRDVVVAVGILEIIPVEEVFDVELQIEVLVDPVVERPVDAGVARQRDRVVGGREAPPGR